VNVSTQIDRQQDRAFWTSRLPSNYDHEQGHAACSMHQHYTSTPFHKEITKLDKRSEDAGAILIHNGKSSVEVPHAAILDACVVGITSDRVRAGS